MKDVKSMDRDYLLGLLGLERKTTFVDWIFPALGIFGAGVILGASLGMVFAPKPGREVRETIRNRLQSAGHGSRPVASEATT